MYQKKAIKRIHSISFSGEETVVPALHRSQGSAQPHGVN